MTKTLSAGSAAVGVTALSLVGFFGSPLLDIKVAFIVLYVAATGAVFFIATRSLAFDQFLATAIVAAIGSTLVVQLLGLSLFTEVLRDVAPFTLAFALRTIAWYASVAAFAYMVAKQNRFWVAALVTVGWEILFIFGAVEECWDCPPDGYHKSYAAAPLWVYVLGPFIGSAFALLSKRKPPLGASGIHTSS